MPGDGAGPPGKVVKGGVGHPPPLLAYVAPKWLWLLLLLLLFFWHCIWPSLSHNYISDVGGHIECKSKEGRGFPPFFVKI